MHLLICISICIHCCFFSVIIIVILFPSKYIQRVASFRSETSALIDASSVVRLKGKICSYPEWCQNLLRISRDGGMLFLPYGFFLAHSGSAKNTDCSWRYSQLRQDIHHKSIMWVKKKNYIWHQTSRLSQLILGRMWAFGGSVPRSRVSWWHAEGVLASLPRFNTSQVLSALGLEPRAICYEKTREKQFILNCIENHAIMHILSAIKWFIS